MFIVYDYETQSVIGPFDDNTDAEAFVQKIHDYSRLNIQSLEVYEMESPDDWTYNNLDDLLMTNS